MVKDPTVAAATHQDFGIAEVDLELLVDGIGPIHQDPRVVARSEYQSVDIEHRHESF